LIRPPAGENQRSIVNSVRAEEARSVPSAEYAFTRQKYGLPGNNLAATSAGTGIAVSRVSAVQTGSIPSMTTP
jgi:hypothetical protein